MSAKRKPTQKVRSIKGNFAPDIITQGEMREASERQATVWLAEKNAREIVQRIEARLQAGATEEPGSLMFYRELQMVRTRRI